MEHKHSKSGGQMPRDARRRNPFRRIERSLVAKNPKSGYFSPTRSKIERIERILIIGSSSKTLDVQSLKMI